MMNYIWVAMLLFSVITAFFHGETAALSTAVMHGAAESVQLALTLTGALCFWSGIAEISEKSGFAEAVQKLLSPILRRIFTQTEPDSPAFNAIAMNITANLLGLGNAATPLGLRAMRELQKSNPDMKSASPDMIKFVVMNTASLQLIPTTAAAVRAEAGSAAPFDILLPVWISSFLALVVGLLAAFLLTPKRARAEKKTTIFTAIHRNKSVPLRSSALLPLILALPLLSGSAVIFEQIGNAALPLTLALILIFAVCKGAAVFDCFLSGGKKGLTTAVNLLPSLCGLVTAVEMLQQSSAMSLLVKFLSPAAKLTGIPQELLPLCLLRPLSGSGGLSVYKSILKTHGADSVLGRTAAVLSGASETTFYAITVYYGSINIKNTGCTLPAALLADLTCYLVACRSVRLFL